MVAGELLMGHQYDVLWDIFKSTVFHILQLDHIFKFFISP